MKLRITYRVESYIEGKDVQEIKNKFEAGENCENDFVELVSVEDADTSKDMIDEWFEFPIIHKYNTGDWIVSEDGKVYYILDVIGKTYSLEDKFSTLIIKEISEIDATYHKWTIADAKDYDILYIPDTLSTVIFKCKNKRCKDLLCYCGYDGIKKILVEDEDYWSFINVLPATQSQRETLTSMITNLKKKK